jgi:hypothetical protein
MNESIYGNASWHGYVLAAYVVVFVVLGAFAWFSLRSARRSIEDLSNEGFLKD